MYKNIIVGFDNSENGKRALERASQMCLSLDNCQLTVLHVNEERSVTKAPPLEGVGRDEYVATPRIDGGVYTSGIPIHTVPENSNQEIIEDSVDSNVYSAREILEAKGIQAKYEILDGHTVDNISEYAEQNEADLIVVGGSEKSGFKKFFTGSVSEDLLKSTSIDLLIVQ